jgi:hypothetical protein
MSRSVPSGASVAAPVLARNPLSHSMFTGWAHGSVAGGRGVTAGVTAFRHTFCRTS